MRLESQWKTREVEIGIHWIAGKGSSCYRKITALRADPRQNREKWRAF
jgi:hypothetical protein